jgi:hypothetical protein
MKVHDLQRIRQPAGPEEAQHYSCDKNLRQSAYPLKNALTESIKQLPSRQSLVKLTLGLSIYPMICDPVRNFSAYGPQVLRPMPRVAPAQPIQYNPPSPTWDTRQQDLSASGGQR